MCPITHSSPTTVGCSAVVCSTLPSWMLVRAPMRISPSSARSTACGQTELSGPICTEPMTTASGWTNALGVDLRDLSTERVDRHGRDRNPRKVSGVTSQ